MNGKNPGTIVPWFLWVRINDDDLLINEWILQLSAVSG